MAYSQFSFVPSPTGTLPGDSFIQQTEDAINALGEQQYTLAQDNETLTVKIDQAVSTAGTALSTANSAHTTAQGVSQQVATLTTTVNSYDQKITQAVSQSSSALQASTAAQQAAQSAQGAAQAAQTAAEGSASQAQQAQAAAETAQQQAAASQTAAEAAQDQAENAVSLAENAQQQAQTAAQSAQESATTVTELSSTAVQVVEQEFSEEQQAQARQNVGAAAAADSALTGTTTAEAISVTGQVTATGGFVGNLSGTAARATADANGNAITTTYATIADTYTKAQVDAKVSSVYRIMGSVASYDDLPTSGQTVGDVYNALDTGANYVWTESGWDKLSETVDLSGYLTITSAQGTYLTIANAESTYLTQSAASTTYLTQANAQTLYLSQSAAASTYLTQANAQTLYLPISGGTLTGSLLLNGDPTQPLGAATKQYVDSAVSTGASNAVLFTAQTLTTEQQTQACTNIGAAEASEIIALCNELAGVS